MTSSRIVVMSVMSSDALVAKGLAVAFQPRLGFLSSRPDAQFDDAMPRGSARLPVPLPSQPAGSRKLLLGDAPRKQTAPPIFFRSVPRSLVPPRGPRNTQMALWVERTLLIAAAKTRWRVRVWGLKLLCFCFRDHARKRAVAARFFGSKKTRTTAPPCPRCSNHPPRPHLRRLLLLLGSA